MNAIKAISYFHNSSPKRQEHWEKIIKENFPEVTRKTSGCLSTKVARTHRWC